MGLMALVYVFPHVEGIGGFWLVFAAGTAVAAWINFGTPRVSYGGYQSGLAFYKAVFQDFGPALSATVVRDRLIGVFFGLIVFGIVEHMLWPVRAADRMRERLADVLRSLSDLARRDGAGADNVDASRRLISQQIADVQGFIESSKFEPGVDTAERIARLVGDAQTVFLILLALARDEGEGPAPSPSRQAVVRRLRMDVSSALRALAEHVRGAEPVAPDMLPGTVSATERALADLAGMPSADRGPVNGSDALYRALVASVEALITSELDARRIHA